MVTKKCGRCGVEKDGSEFGINRAEKDGLQHWCRQCHHNRREERKQEYRKRETLPQSNLRTKKCPNCGVEKEVTEFYANKSKCDNLQSWCKECIRKYDAAHRGKPAKSDAPQPIDDPIENLTKFFGGFEALTIELRFLRKECKELTIKNATQAETITKLTEKCSFWQSLASKWSGMITSLQELLARKE